MITYTTGDATDPQGVGQGIIAHICNDIGGWGSGFVVALSKRDRQPELCYREWHENTFYLDGDREVRFALGNVQFAAYDPHANLWPSDELIVANMIAQHGIRRSPKAPRATDYDALHSCLDQVAELAYTRQIPVHMPRIGTGLGGGRWSEIEPIILDTLVSCGIDVTVYDLPSTRS